MMAMSEQEVVDRAIEAAELHGYSTEAQPVKRTGWKVLGIGPSERIFSPDLLIHHGDKSAVIEVKTTPPLLGAVSQSREYGDHFGAQPVICVPDTSFEKIPESVKDFAGRVNVRLYPVSQIADALKILLE